MQSKGILLSGFKKSGKDTFADLLLKFLKEEHGIHGKKYFLAYKLKKVCSKISGLGMSYMENQDLKEKKLQNPIVLDEDKITLILRMFDVPEAEELARKIIRVNGRARLDQIMNEGSLRAFLLKLKHEFIIGSELETIKKLGVTTHDTSRSLMQFVGTEVLRHVHPDIHCRVTTKVINEEMPEVYLISDCRFDNEVAFFDAPAMFIDRKDKYPENTPDLHPSEKNMFTMKESMRVIDNNSTLLALETQAREVALEIANKMTKRETKLAA